MESDEVVFTSITQQPDFGPGGKLKRFTVYNFTVGEHGPFTLRFAEGTDDPAAVMAGVAAQVEKLKAIGAVRTRLPGAS